MTHPTSTLRPGGRVAPDRERSRPGRAAAAHLVGAILRARREDQGRTLRDVAESARVSVAYLSEVERGRKEPSSEVLSRSAGPSGCGSSTWSARPTPSSPAPRAAWWST